MKKFLILIIILFSFLCSPFLIFAENVNKNTDLKIESEKTPEVKRSIPILEITEPEPISSTPTFRTQALSAPSQNLILNASLETSGSNGLPAEWKKGGYGTNARTLTYLATGGNNGSKGIKAVITAYTSGDAKWYGTDVSVTSGHTYTFSDYYKSNIPSIVTARFSLSNGQFLYKDILLLNPSSVFAKAETQFTAPANSTAVTFFHLIKQVGELTTDDYSLIDTTSTPPDPEPEPDNLVANPKFEIASSTSQPASWKKGRWGTNTTLFSYPVLGPDSSKAAKVEITNYTSGDAKWYFDSVPVSSGIYTYSNHFSSNRQSYITVQFEKTNGTFSYQDIAIMSPTDSFANASFDFFVPIGLTKITVFHLIKGIGYLTLDDVSLKLKSAPKGIFTTGGVSFRFDDGWLSQYENAVPKLNSRGFKGAFFIVTERIDNPNFPGFVNSSQIHDLYNSGHEIGAHTRTHSDLGTLTTAQQQNEIAGSRNDLLAMNVGPINSFAYPFGSYAAETIQIIKNSGFKSAVATIEGYAVPTSDKYQLERKSLEVGTTLAEMKSWVDDAQANKKWLIIAAHEVSNNGNLYSVTPANFNALVDYVAQKGIPVVTIDEGLKSMN